MNKLKPGDKITIRYSKKLEQNGNGLLINRVGEVTRVVYAQGQVVGAYVDIKTMRRVKSYYIPVSSIEGPDDINRIRNLVMLKSIIL